MRSVPPGKNPLKLGAYTILKMSACIGLLFFAVLQLLHGLGVTHLSLMAEEMLVGLIATSVVAGRFLLVQ
ncbi:hypothetical protein NKW54_09015 [Acetobacter cerevisiae]|uniref:Uncharacterized protein n=1 Tax=Acetobacter cerevisiae TaxID=178900 RepID=A0A149URE7_9PROT|nr:hypothetical protein [Acetobacter cerevisiae]KXV70560.1 hypothetical protein AD952_12575 [Acetobacter cerevisiae]MCP1246078.1 hypothetical protein [Acetobacter cerevisiae]MCP1255551.1 hypothetical protein [Acetobacter cerevisiae]